MSYYGRRKIVASDFQTDIDKTAFEYLFRQILNSPLFLDEEFLILHLQRSK